MRPRTTADAFADVARAARELAAMFLGAVGLALVTIGAHVFALALRAAVGAELRLWGDDAPTL